MITSQRYTKLQNKTVSKEGRKIIFLDKNDYGIMQPFCDVIGVFQLLLFPTSIKQHSAGPGLF